MRRVMIFGTFDGIHDGHRAFITQARGCGDFLIAVVAQDQTARQLKGTYPRMNLDERCESLRREKGVDEVVAGDPELGVWNVLKKYKPDVVALGYDQQPLKESLETYLTVLDWVPDIRVMKFHNPQYSNVKED